MHPMRKLDRSIRISAETQIAIWELKARGITYDQVIRALLRFRAKAVICGPATENLWINTFQEVTQ